MPGGDPVTIDNVNLGDNASLYNSNSSPANGGFDIEYDGFTDVLTASATGLDTSIAHTLSIQIADTGDSIYDSAVFLAAGTLGDKPPEPPVPGIPEPATWMMMLAGFALVGTAMKRRRRMYDQFA